MNRFLLYTAGAVFALIALYLVVSTVIGLLVTLAFWALAIFAVVGIIALVRRGASPKAVREAPRARAVTADPQFTVGDTVRPTAAFDGPMELAFCDGTVEMISKKGIMVRFENGDFHSVSPDAIRRI